MTQLFRMIAVGCLALPAIASDLLPLDVGNTWFLKNRDQNTAAFTVEEVTSSPTHKLARIKFEDEKSTYSWILLEDNSGVSLAGFNLNGTDHYFDEPSPFIPSNGDDGQVWNGVATRVTRIVTDLNFRTPAGQMRKGVEFQIEFVNGLTHRWIMVPGVGFGAGGEVEKRLLLQTYDLKPAAAAGGQDGTCPKIGISSIPAVEGLNTEQREAALAPVVGLGANFLSVSIGWNELEPQPFRYTADRLRDELALASKYQISTVLNIRPIDNVRDLRPADLANKSWDDPETLTRFAGALSFVLESLPPEVRWINIGYEIDPYFLTQPETAPGFLRFFLFAKELAKQKSQASVGIVFSFDVTRYYNDIYRFFEGSAEHVAFNYYALRTGTGYSHRPAESPALDALIMRSLAKDRPILITEAGYSSHPAVGGGPDAQAAYFANLIASLRGSGKFVGLNIWSLYDLPEDQVRATQRAYRLEEHPGAAEFLSGLGLVTADGSAKPSLSSVAGEIARIAGCTL